MKLSRAIIIILVTLLGATEASVSVSKERVLSSRFSSDDYINSKEISAANGKYSMYVEGLGTVLIHSVRYKATQATKTGIKSCLIDKRALESEILQSFKNLSGRGLSSETTKEIKMKGIMQGGQMVCSSGGSNCTVIVSKPGCSYDPDSAELPCS